MRPVTPFTKWAYPQIGVVSRLALPGAWVCMKANLCSWRCRLAAVLRRRDARVPHLQLESATARRCLGRCGRRRYARRCSELGVARRSSGLSFGPLHGSQRLRQAFNAPRPPFELPTAPASGALSLRPLRSGHVVIQHARASAALPSFPVEIRVFSQDSVEVCPCARARLLG